MTRVTLASTSRYRGQLLRRLLEHFDQCAPGVEESVLEGELPAHRAQRLAELKARAVAGRTPDTVVIGSDQVAALDERILDKPGDSATACGQLADCSARAVDFHTAICLIDTRTAPARKYTHTDLTRVFFRPLDPAAIARYVEREQPLDCAGSFKCEGLGISLFERIENTDPSALIGLPLIALARLLRECELQVP